MTSDPVPVLHMIGKSPAMIATTVIIFGAHAFDRASHDRGMQIGTRELSPLRRAFRSDLVESMVEIDEHHDARFRCDACQRNIEPDGHSNGKIETEPPQQPPARPPTRTEATA